MWDEVVKLYEIGEQQQGGKEKEKKNERGRDSSCEAPFREVGWPHRREYPRNECLGLAGEHCLFSIREQFPAKRADGAIATAGSAVLAGVINDLEMKLVPCVSREKLLQIPLGRAHGLPCAELPPLGQPVDVSIYGKTRLIERLGHDDLSGLVPYPGELLQLFQDGRDDAAMFLNEDLGQVPDSLGLLRTQAARSDDGLDLSHLYPAHGERIVCQGEECWRDEIHPGIGTLRGEQDGNEEGIRVLMIQRDGWIWIQSDKADEYVLGALLSGHAGIFSGLRGEDQESRSMRFTIFSMCGYLARGFMIARLLLKLPHFMTLMFTFLAP